MVMVRWPGTLLSFESNLVKSLVTGRDEIGIQEGCATVQQWWKAFRSSARQPGATPEEHKARLEAVTCSPTTRPSNRVISIFLWQYCCILAVRKAGVSDAPLMDQRPSPQAVSRKEHLDLRKSKILPNI